MLGLNPAIEPSDSSEEGFNRRGIGSVPAKSRDAIDHRFVQKKRSKFVQTSIVTVPCLQVATCDERKRRRLREPEHGGPAMALPIRLGVKDLELVDLAQLTITRSTAARKANPRSRQWLVAPCSEFGARHPPKPAQLAPMIRNGDGVVSPDMDDQVVVFVAERLKACLVPPTTEGHALQHIGRDR